MRRSLLALLVAALPLTAALVAACDGASPSHTASPGSCTLTPLAAAGTGDNDAGAFNASGVVIGRAAQTPGSPPQPVIWRAGTATPIPLPPAMTGGNAADINDRGEVVGTLTDADGATHAYHWDGTYLTLLKGLPGGTSTYARRINATGQIAGTAHTGDGHDLAVRWQDPRSAPTPLRPAAADIGSWAKAINNQGVTGGSSDTAAGAEVISRPALWSGRGQVRILDGIGGPDTEGEIFEVTDTGLAAGASATSREHSDPSFAFHATRWDTNSTPHDLGTLTGDNFSQALGLAPNGYVAGLSATVDATTGEPGIGHAFIWSGDGPLHPLPLPGLDWTATSSIAHQIDDHGIVAGAYTPPGGPSRAALWTCTTPS